MVLVAIAVPQNRFTVAIALHITIIMGLKCSSLFFKIFWMMHVAISSWNGDTFESMNWLLSGFGLKSEKKSTYS